MGDVTTKQLSPVLFSKSVFDVVHVLLSQGKAQLRSTIEQQDKRFIYFTF